MRTLGGAYGANASMTGERGNKQERVSIPATETRGLASLMGKQWNWAMECPLKVANGEIGFGK